MLLRLLLSILASWLIYKIYVAFFGPLSRFPGSLSAKFSDIWRFMDVWKGQHQHTLRKLHSQYHSPIIRIGPNLLSLSDARWINIIYSTKSEFKKTNMYEVNDIKLPNGAVVPTTFSVRDEQVHAEMMKPIQRLYNLNNVEFD